MTSIHDTALMLWPTPQQHQGPKLASLSQQERHPQDREHTQCTAKATCIWLHLIASTSYLSAATTAAALWLVTNKASHHVLCRRPALQTHSLVNFMPAQGLKPGLPYRAQARGKHSPADIQL